MHLRQENPPLCGCDHMAFRSAYFPVKDVIDGDLCEQYPILSSEFQNKIADDLHRTPGLGFEEPRRHQKSDNFNFILVNIFDRRLGGYFVHPYRKYCSQFLLPFLSLVLHEFQHLFLLV